MKSLDRAVIRFSLLLLNVIGLAAVAGVAAPAAGCNGNVIVEQGSRGAGGGRDTTVTTSTGNTAGGGGATTTGNTAGGGGATTTGSTAGGGGATTTGSMAGGGTGGGAVMMVQIKPTVTGTIRYLPELGILDLAPVQEAIQSTYFKTTNQNREWRRGILEFAIPNLGTIVSATLELQADSGGGGSPVPPDNHAVSSYQADLLLTPQDYDLPAELVTKIQIDANDDPKPLIQIDLTAPVSGLQGSKLGIRIELDLPQVYAEYNVLGAGFSPWGSVIVIEYEP